MLNKEDWMEIKAQIARGVYQKDIADELGVHPIMDPVFQTAP